MARVNVVTLWNTGRYYYRWNKLDINDVFTSDYVNYRLKLLREITLPSLECQTDKGFTWLVFTNTFVVGFNEFYALVKHLKPTIVDTSKRLNDIDDFIREVLTSFNGDVFEIKLDSDDAISRDFVRIVRQLPVEYYRVYYPRKHIIYLYETKKFVEYDDSYTNCPIIVKSNNKENWLYEKRHYEYKKFARYIDDDRIFYVYTQHKLNHHTTLCNDISKFYKYYLLNRHKIIKYLEEEVPWLM